MSFEVCGNYSKKAQRKLRAARRAARKDQFKRARQLRRAGRKLRRQARSCNRRQGR